MSYHNTCKLVLLFHSEINFKGVQAEHEDYDYINGHESSIQSYSSHRIPSRSGRRETHKFKEWVQLLNIYDPKNLSEKVSVDHSHDCTVCGVHILLLYK